MVKKRYVVLLLLIPITFLCGCTESSDPSESNIQIRNFHVEDTSEDTVIITMSVVNNADVPASVTVTLYYGGVESGGGRRYFFLDPHESDDFRDDYRILRSEYGDRWEAKVTDVTWGENEDESFFEKYLFWIIGGIIGIIIIGKIISAVSTSSYRGSSSSKNSSSTCPSCGGPSPNGGNCPNCTAAITKSQSYQNAHSGRRY